MYGVRTLRMQRQTGKKRGRRLNDGLGRPRMIHFPRHGSKGLIYFPSNFRLRHGHCRGGKGSNTSQKAENSSLCEQTRVILVLGLVNYVLYGTKIG